MSDNLREQAQQGRNDVEAGVTVLAVLIDVVGEVDWIRGFQFRRARIATADDLRAALAKLEDIPTE